jgi:hypothetical protein
MVSPPVNDVGIRRVPRGQACFKHLLRRIVVWDADQQREIVLLTNHFDFGAATLAKIYKDR